MNMKDKELGKKAKEYDKIGEGRKEERMERKEKTKKKSIERREKEVR